jgi:hypothetical protein
MALGLPAVANLPRGIDLIDLLLPLLPRLHLALP